MREFDELLSEVLAADVCVDSPDGMERRIKAALLAATRRPGSERRYPWMAIAAMLLIGFVGGLAVRYRNGIAPTARSGEEISIARAATPGTEPVTAPVVEVSLRQQHSLRSASAVRSDRPLSRAVASITSLEVGNLVLQPIEVASLASDKLTKQSPGWEEQR